MFLCSYCKKDFSRQYNLDRHISVCKLNPNKLIYCDICLKEYKSIKRYNSHIEKCKNKGLITLKKEKIKKAIELTEYKIQKIKNKLEKSSTTIVKNSINTYELESLDLSQQRFDKIVSEKYAYETFINCTIIEDVIIPFLSNNNGKICSKIKDINRFKLLCIDKNKGVIYHDPVTIVGLCSESNKLQDKNKEYINNTSINLNNMSKIICMVEQSRDFNVMKNNLKKNINKFIDKTPEQKKEVIIRFIE